MNERFRAARERTRSLETPGEALSRRELSDLVRAWLVENRQRDTAIDEVHIGKIERGEIMWPGKGYREALRAVLGVATDAELGFSRPRRRTVHQTADAPTVSGFAPHDSVPAIVVGLDGTEAIDLIRRIETTDIGQRTVDAVVAVIDGLCRSYTHVAPARMLRSLIAYQVFIGQLLDRRSTLAERRQLIRQAGWLSLLTATADIDLGHDHAATANFRAARTMADEAGDAALAGAIHETEAWRSLSQGDLTSAAQHCRAGLQVAPRSSPAQVQLRTQLARVAAKLGDAQTTYEQVDECLAALDRLPSAEGPEHHFVCDRGRALMHSAAALVWLGDGHPRAEEYARLAVAQYEAHAEPPVHHLAMARMNLALHLAQTDEPAAATAIGAQALEPAWRLCQTDLFLASDLDVALTRRFGRSTEIVEFHERYEAMQAAVAATSAETTSLPMSGAPTE